MSAPQLTKQFIHDLLEEVNSEERKELRRNDLRRYQIYNGHLGPALNDAIKSEFKKPETIKDLLFRLVPINIVRKIINKLAGLYIEAPVREATDKNDSDQMLITDYEQITRINLRMKEANRYFKLFKRNLMEPYINDEGFPQLRNLPRHQYEVFSHSMVDPQIPDVVVKIISESPDPQLSKYVIWTPDQHLVVNGKGEIDMRTMIGMNNPDGINPFGVLPFVYINESSQFVDPIPNDDLLKMGILIPLLLTDLAFASKYQTWSIIYVTNFEGEIPASPNSIISLPTGPDGKEPKIGTIKPEFSMIEQLEFVKQLVGSLLSTNNLSTSGVVGQLDARSPESGISKALDESQSTEDKKDQQEYFLKAEDELWTLWAHVMIPYWRRTGMLNPLVNKEFSQAFVLNIILREPKAYQGDKEKIEISKMRLDNGLSTLTKELQFLYPDMTDEEIEQLKEEIEMEHEDKVESQVERMLPMNDNLMKEDENNEEV